VRKESIFFAIALLLFGVFAANVILGSARQPVFMNDVSEMLTLFGACIFFVVAVLILERDKNSTNE
jgi:hypothetical protein